jgi:putative membrane protein
VLERYSDHAANERTFLAWVRTALAVMAFGFLVEKFDLFLEVAAASLTAHALSIGGRVVGDIAGLLLILLGGIMMVMSAVRYREVRRAIENPELVRGGAGRTDLILVGLLILLGATLFIYLVYTVVKTLEGLFAINESAAKLNKTWQEGRDCRALGWRQDGLIGFHIIGASP